MDGTGLLFFRYFASVGGWVVVCDVVGLLWLFFSAPWLCSHLGSAFVGRLRLSLDADAGVDSLWSVAGVSVAPSLYEVWVGGFLPVVSWSGSGVRFACTRAS